MNSPRRLRLGLALSTSAFALRVRPETSSGIAEFSEHEADRRELEEGERSAVEVLPVLCQTTAAVEPGDGALDDPALGQHDEALDLI